ncbi:cupin domain-containing protein [Ruminococcus sp. CLA-AA-H200]|uniref:Cupin domain-containing protein n=1 Tax=Ruminococcus turbiniformis TaxID=2881258 RepID=A0ABS8FTQ5_9FIRM|nr:cupin domain-containing protein [Ruminococcus turbiniformis]MCC2253395.1 cupin domain-containing protein [Ruminococcus turbiniformis]
MIRRWKDMSTEKVECMKGGKGEVELINILEMDEMYNMGRFFGVTVIPPGCSGGCHTHTGDFETYFILEGKAVINDNGTEYELGPGDMMQCRDGSSHGIRNDGDCDLKYLAVILYSPSGESSADKTDEDEPASAGKTAEKGLE